MYNYVILFDDFTLQKTNFVLMNQNKYLILSSQTSLQGKKKGKDWENVQGTMHQVKNQYVF